MLKWDDIAYLDLAEHRPVARGGMRNVYEVPEFPDMLIKTIRRDRADASGSFPEYGRIKNLRAFGAYHVFQRECFEYLRQARLRYSEQQFSLPAAHFFGFVQTSEGLGAIVEKVAGPNGDLAPTLAPCSPNKPSNLCTKPRCGISWRPASVRISSSAT